MQVGLLRRYLLLVLCVVCVVLCVRGMCCVCGCVMCDMCQCVVRIAYAVCVVWWCAFSSCEDGFQFYFILLWMINEIYVVFIYVDKIKILVPVVRV